MPILTFTGSQHRLLLPDGVKDRVAPWIQTQATTSYRTADQAPFRRMIDFWFASIAWAVCSGLTPIEQASGKFFVSLGPNPNDIRNFEEWRADLIVVLGVREFGPKSADIADTRRLIDLANRYAEAGASSLLDRLEQSADLALPRLYVVADVLERRVTDAAAERQERTF